MDAHRADLAVEMFVNRKMRVHDIAKELKSCNATIGIVLTERLGKDRYRMITADRKSLAMEEFANRRGLGLVGAASGPFEPPHWVFVRPWISQPHA